MVIRWKKDVSLSGARLSADGGSRTALESRNHVWHDGSPLVRVNAKFWAKGTSIMSSGNERTAL